MEKYIEGESLEIFSTSTDCRVHSLASKSTGNPRYKNHFDTVYFSGKYRYGYVRSDVKRAIAEPIANIYDRYVTLYDGNRDGIVWNYGIKERDASPLPASCFRYFQKMMKQRGEKSLRQQFKIPPSISLKALDIVREIQPGVNDLMRNAINLQSEEGILRAHSTGPNFYVDRVPSWGSLPPVICPFPMDFRLMGYNNKNREIGAETVCGRRCAIIQCDWGRGTRKYWIDPKTRFVMRSEGIDTTFPEGSGNYKWAYSQFDPIAKADSIVFSLPPGTKIYLPELMWDYPLPPGMTRARKGGALKILGFPLYPTK